MDFFDDIFIPGNRLQAPSKFDENEQLWFWEYENDEGKHPLYMELGEKIRFRVISETFVDTSPTGPTETSVSETASDSASTEAKKADCKVPYSITASVSEPGLGLLSWWT